MGDVDAAVRVLVRAFGPDALMRFLFSSHPEGVGAGSFRFFSILMRARIALRMPTILCEHEGRIVGAAMGYDTDPPEWPEEFNSEWRVLADRTPGFADRLKVYEGIATRSVPHEPHYYLGVLGVDPEFHGGGFGKALLDEVCRLSAEDPRSHGVYLETASERSLEFYFRNEFELCGEGDLDGSPLWCVYRHHE